MKKVIVAVSVCLALVFCTQVAKGGFSIVLATTTGGLLVHGGTAYPADALPAGRMIQIIWSTVNAYTASGTPISLTDAQGNTVVQPSLVDPTHYLLWTGYTPTSDGLIDTSPDIDGNFTYLNSHVGGNNINAGYLYIRIFDAASPTIGTWYHSSAIYDTSTFTMQPSDPPQPPDVLDVIWGAPYAIDIGGGYLNPCDHGQVVPEPTTWAMGLMGLGLLVYRRLRK